MIMLRKLVDSLINDEGFLLSHGKLYRKNNHHFKRLCRIFAIVKEIAPKVILEIGGSDGMLARIIIKELEIEKYYFTEPCGWNLHKARLNLAGNDRVAIYPLDILKDGIHPRGVDLLVCSEVLEHLPDYSQALSNILAARPSHILISVPTEMGWPGFLKSVVRKFHRKERISYRYLLDCFLKRDITIYRSDPSARYLTHIGFHNIRFEETLEDLFAEHYEINIVDNKVFSLTMGKIYRLTAMTP